MCGGIGRPMTLAAAKWGCKGRNRPMWSTDTPRELLPVASDAERPMHGGTSPGAPKGNRNTYKHGRYTAEAIERRRELASLLRAMRGLSAEAK